MHYGGEIAVHTGQLLIAALVTVIGFVMVVVGQTTTQFFGILAIVIGIIVALVADLAKPSVSSEH